MTPRLKRLSMPSRPSRAMVQPVARCVVVGALGAALLLGVDRLGTVAAAPGTEAAPRVAATSATDYCAGDPFTDEAEVSVSGTVEAHAAPPEVLEEIITTGEDPGVITIGDIAEEQATQEAAPEEGPAAVSEDIADLEGAARVAAAGAHAPGLISGQSMLASGDRATGLAALPCTEPTADAWLVSGGAEKGRQEHLVLSNPGGNGVSVRIEALGVEGEESLVVPPGSREVVLLDAIGGTDTPQVVHVTSSGGLVVPTIVDRHLDGLVPAGVETSAATTGPGSRQVIPAAADGDAHGMVIGVPGDSDAVVQVRSLGEGGARSATVETVSAGSVTDIELPEVEGVHSWLVESDEPVVAAGHLTVDGGGGQRDMAWSVATRAFGGLGAAMLPADTGGDARQVLDIVADEDGAEATVHVLGDDGLTSEDVSLEAGHGTNVDLGDARAVWVRPTSGSVHAGVLVLGEGDPPRATSIPLQPVRVANRDIEVIHRR